jgi:hypothetical protein
MAEKYDCQESYEVIRRSQAEYLSKFGTHEERVQAFHGFARSGQLASRELSLQRLGLPVLVT